MVQEQFIPSEGQRINIAGDKSVRYVLNADRFLCFQVRRVLDLGLSRVGVGQRTVCVIQVLAQV